MWAGARPITFALRFLLGSPRTIFDRKPLADSRNHSRRGAAAAGSKNATAEELDYADYRRIDGVETPYQITLVALAAATITVAHRVERACERFRIRLSNAKAARCRTSKRFSSMWPESKAIELQKQYTCHVIAEEEISSKETSLARGEGYDVFNCGGDEIRHLVKDDSKPLTAEQQHKEDERFNKEFSEFQKKQAELANDPKKQEKEYERQQTQISDFLRAESFTIPRRVRFRGQDVIVFDFGPNPDFKP
jgi:hypothetical protein